MEGKVGLIKMNISTEKNISSDEITNLIWIFAIRIAKKDRRVASRSKPISIMFGCRNETKRTNS